MNRFAGYVRALMAAALACLVALPAGAQAGDEEAGEDPPTTLPFEPTVRSAPPPERAAPPAQETPARNTAPETRSAPPPGDPLCKEIGPIIRAGVVASRFARLTPSTAEGAVIGTFAPGKAMQALGAAYCTVVIPAAAPETAGSAWNQVTCQLGMDQGESPYLDGMRTRRDELAGRIADCPAVSQWTGTPPEAGEPGGDNLVEDHVFTHDDVAVEIVVRASHRTKAGDWPLSHVRSLDLIFRTPNPDRPDPEAEQPAAEAISSGP